MPRSFLQHEDENPYKPSTPSVSELTAPVGLGGRITAMVGWCRALFGIRPLPDAEHVRLRDALEAFFEERPLARFWVVAVDDPTELITRGQVRSLAPNQFEFFRIARDTHGVLPRCFMLFDASNITDDPSAPLLELCAFLVVSKRQSAGLRQVAAVCFSEDISKKIISKSSFAQALEENVQNKKCQQ
jgi:hypothetical protein